MRSLLPFALMVTCGAATMPLKCAEPGTYDPGFLRSLGSSVEGGFEGEKFMQYGNWYGPGWWGGNDRTDGPGNRAPVDALDALAMRHDFAYQLAEKQGRIYGAKEEQRLKAMADYVAAQGAMKLDPDPRRWDPPPADPFRADRYRNKIITGFDNLVGPGRELGEKVLATGDELSQRPYPFNFSWKENLLRDAYERRSGNLDNRYDEEQLERAVTILVNDWQEKNPDASIRDATLESAGWRAPGRQLTKEEMEAAAKAIGDAKWEADAGPREVSLENKLDIRFPEKDALSKKPEPSRPLTPEELEALKSIAETARTFDGGNPEVSLVEKPVPDEVMQRGKDQLGFLRELAGTIGQQNQELAQQLQKARQAQGKLPEIRAQLAKDQTLLAAFTQGAEALKGSPAELRAGIQKIASDLNTIRTTADGMAGPVSNAIAQLQAQQMSPEAGRQLLTSGAKRYEALQTACTELEQRAEALVKLAQPTEAAAAVAAARDRTAALATDLKEAAAFFANMEQLAGVQRQAIRQFSRRRDHFINEFVGHYYRAKGLGKEMLRDILLEAEKLDAGESPAGEALKTAQELKLETEILLRTAQKMPFPPEEAQRNMVSSEQFVKEFTALKDPAEKADASMARLRDALLKLERAIGLARGPDKPPGPIPPPKNPIPPGRKEEPGPESVLKPAGQPDYAAMAGQCNAIYNASMQRRFAKYRKTLGGDYKLDVRKPWTWNPARQRFECDIAVWQTAPDRNDDPKTFKPYITSILGGAISVSDARANIKSGKWFGE